MSSLLDSNDLVVINEMFDDIFDTYKKLCRVYHPSIWETCDNCVYDTIGNKPSNRYRTGGPTPFHAVACPMCNGQGKRATEVYSDIYMTIDWNPGNTLLKKWMTVAANTNLASGLIMTRFKATDYGKVQQCVDMLLIGSLAPYNHYRYKLAGESSDAIQASSDINYFIGIWERVG